MTVYEDARQRPELFCWQGPIPPDRLDVWLEERALRVPSDLRDVWIRTGGGEMFETETLLAPCGAPSLGDDIDGVNMAYQSRGLPSNFLLFHIGLCDSVVRFPETDIIVFRAGSFIPQHHFASFEPWYQNVIRDEYAERYCLERT